MKCIHRTLRLRISRLIVSVCLYSEFSTYFVVKKRLYRKRLCRNILQNEKFRFFPWITYIMCVCVCVCVCVYIYILHIIYYILYIIYTLIVCVYIYKYINIHIYSIIIIRNRITQQKNRRTEEQEQKKAVAKIFCFHIFTIIFCMKNFKKYHTVNRVVM